jgi:hypothetical protein
MGSGEMTQSDDEIQRRKKLTFAQAEGAEALPSQLKRTEVSKQLRAVLWDYIYEQLQDTAERQTYAYVGDPWRTVLENVHVYLSTSQQMNLPRGLMTLPTP